MDEYNNIGPFDLSVAKENLLLFKEVFDEKGVTFALMYGTLLGAIREHNFISHDDDIDIIAFDNDGVLDLIPNLLEKGFKLVRYFEWDLSNEYVFSRKGIHVDIFMVCPVKGIKGKLYVGLWGKLFPKKYFKELVNYEFLGLNFQIPKNPEILCKYLYGKNWQLPAGNHAINESRSLSKLRKMVAFIFGKRTSWLKNVTGLK